MTVSAGHRPGVVDQRHTVGPLDNDVDGAVGAGKTVGFHLDGDVRLIRPADCWAIGAAMRATGCGGADGGTDDAGCQ